MLFLGNFHAFVLFFIYIWVLWGMKMLTAKQYKPFTGSSDFETSIIIPVVDEPTNVFTFMLQRIQGHNPEEILVVINGERNLNLQNICDELGVRWVWTEQPGKRNALKIGIEHTTKEIVVLVDSDTIWNETETLDELVKPFNNAEIGGVSTRQQIFGETRNVITLWASWLEEIRNRYSMPAMSVHGQVGCLPGRTIAFRRTVIENSMEEFLNEQFLGVKLEVSDDRSLTNYCLKQGYKTVMQDTSIVWTDAPTKWRVLYKQQLRWARGSQYNTLRMIPWMFKNAPYLLVQYLSDIIMPFFLIGIMLGWATKLFFLESSVNIYDDLPFDGGIAWVFITLSIIIGSSVSFISRQGWAYKRFGFHLITFMLINTFLLTPVRVMGFFGMAKNASWGTRSNSFEGEKVQYSIKTLFPKVIGLAMIAGFTYLSI